MTLKAHLQIGGGYPDDLASKEIGGDRGGGKEQEEEARHSASAVRPKGAPPATPNPAITPRPAPLKRLRLSEAMTHERRSA